MDRKSLGKTEIFRCTVSAADTEKEKSIRKQVSFQTSAERRRGICFTGCSWLGIPELGGRVRESSETKLLFGVFSIALGICRRG